MVFWGMPSRSFYRFPAIAAAALTAALAACSFPADRTEPPSASDLRTKLRLTRPDSLQSQTAMAEADRARGSPDLVGPDGRCAGDGAPETQPASRALYFQAGPEAARGPNAPASIAPAPGAPGAPQIPRGIALDMSECDVVRAVGYPGQVEISTNERGERSVILTYVEGERAGVYRFVAGRLKSMERAPEPPAPAKPAPAKKPGKKPAAG
jgi:hypothetical protein